MNDWSLHFDQFDPAKEGVRETLCSLGNGYFVIRGAAEESVPDEMHYPGMYLAGGYNRLKTKIFGEEIENEDLVNFPNPLTLTFKIENGNWFNLNEVEVISYEQKLNMREGILSRKIHFQDREGRITRFSIRRFVSMDNPHVAAIEMIIDAENWDGEIEILSSLDGNVENAGVERYMQLNRKHIIPVETGGKGDYIYLKVMTSQSQLLMAQAARTRVSISDKSPNEMTCRTYQEDGYIAQSFKLKVYRSQPLKIEKLITIFTSKDDAISECGYAACRAIERIESFEILLDKHTTAWKYIWKCFDIDISYERAPEDISNLLQLHIFHLMQTTSRHSMALDVGVPPRGWHGEAYRGHILWDEIFIFSTLNLHSPELTGSLLLYRYKRLSEAQSTAKKVGLKGAMYPWQSGSDGREESQRIHLNPQSGRWIPDYSHLQRHVNAAIVYNIWQYFEATADFDFLSNYGAEMIFEIARFWASLTSYNYETDRYEIRGVMGPDEYHDSYPNAEKPGIHNNAYTNVMASWVFTRALQTFIILPKNRKEEIQEVLKLSEEELHTWEKIRKKLLIPFHDGIISQFEGYEKLKELDWEAYQRKYKNIQRMDRILEAEGDHVNNYKASKQADVLMLFYLFSAEELRGMFEEMGYKLKKETILKTVDYYMQRTSHGSTLSQMIHSWVLSRSDRAASWRLFCKAIKSDFLDVQGGTTAEGIHLGAMAGTVDLIQRCYLGIEFRENVLQFNPHLPNELKRVQMRIHYRGHCLLIHLSQKKIKITSEIASAKPICLTCHDQKFSLKEGESMEFKLIR